MGIKKYRLDPLRKNDRGRTTIYTQPRANIHYCLGLDFAYGLPGRDFDAGVMLDEYGEQVAEVHGHWGSMAFGDVLLPLVKWYNAFVVGERQGTGLDTLRFLYDKGCWMYYDRDDETPGWTKRDKLGHHTTGYDRVIPRLQRALGGMTGNGVLTPSKIKVRSRALWNELGIYEYASRRKVDSMDDLRDDDLKMGAPVGEHDDLVRGLGLAVTGLLWLPKFVLDKPKYPVGSIGQLLDHASVLTPDAKPRSRLRLGR